MKRMTVQMPLFEVRIHLIKIGNEVDYVNTLLKPTDVYEGAINAQAYTDVIQCKNYKEFIMVLPEKYKPLLVVHESIHACIAILSYWGIEIDADNHEILPVMVDALVPRAIKKFYGVKI